jgi:hypothetical protein
MAIILISVTAIDRQFSLSAPQTLQRRFESAGLLRR